MYQTDQYEGMIAETVSMKGHNGDTINAYVARPLGAGPVPGMVVIHHAPGWDEWYRECTRRFAHHGYVAISPNLYFRDGHGTPEDVGAKVRAAGGVPDERVLGDLDGANTLLRSLPYVSAKDRRVRHLFGRTAGVSRRLAGLKGFDAVIDCWGGRVVSPKKSSRRTSRSRPSITRKIFPARSSGSSATTTSRRRRNRSTSTRRSSRSTARTTSSIATMAPVMAFSITIARPTVRSRPSTAGKSSRVLREESE